MIPNDEHHPEQYYASPGKRASSDSHRNQKESTSNLKAELDAIGDSPEAFRDFCRRHPDVPAFHNLGDYLQFYLSVHPGLSQADVIREANLPRDYANQYFNGRRQHPDKYKLLPLCIAMGMNLRETNRALTIAGQAQLNIHDSRDAAIILCINRKYSVARTNEFLMDNGLACL